MPWGRNAAGRYVTSNKKYKDMKAAENIRYVELAPRPVRPLIEESAQAIAQLQDIKAERKEHFVGLYLNARYELIHKEIVSIGTVDASIVHPRDVFAPALLHNATAIIVAHNHPSGDATPSAEDREVTQRLKEAGRLLGISVLEHIIITEYGYSTL
jgi:DNA repair protein RadC